MHPTLAIIFLDANRAERERHSRERHPLPHRAGFTRRFRRSD